uniref:Transmembrane protein 8B n=1 Tax=Myripristis murdjan TaxID=586833 RepID=A0A668A332_9TELE
MVKSSHWKETPLTLSLHTFSKIFLWFCSPDCLFVTDYFTRTPRKLNAFNSFASVELFHFNVPDDTMMAVWNLITFKEQGGTFGDSCPDRNVTVYFRSGAPPVINPLYTHFPRDTVVPGSFAVTLTWTLPNRTTGAFNVTSPLPGDWFLAAHLPKDEGKISVKVKLMNLMNKNYFLYLSVICEMIIYYRYCSKPNLSKDQTSPSSSLNMPQSFGTAMGFSLSETLSVADLPGLSQNASHLHMSEDSITYLAPTADPNKCWPIRPTLRNELDTFSVHFYVFFGPNISIPPDRAAVFAINLMPVLDSGGALSPVSNSWFHGINSLFWGHDRNKTPTLTTISPAFVSCFLESVAGFLLSVNASSNITKLRIPYPQTGTWYLSLRSLCATDHGFEACTNVTAEVYMRSYLTPCINDCGTYGQCKLLRTNNYLYAACECKAGWDGWGCTDNSEAYSYSFQLLSTLLLCLSNLMFVPPVAIAIRSHYLLEASVYIFTMFFSTFYHACDQPGIVVFCIMEYDVLQFCDFLGSLMSVWVTVIAMARLKSIIKQVLYLLGAMSLSMALQLDRHGLWNLLGPSLFALGIMAVTVRTIRRRRCYPPTWKRWVFFLFPGTMIATSAVALYAFVETEENYFYIHSIWHMLIAGSVGFLLPPRAKPDAKVTPLKRRRGCGYQLCVNEHEEMGLVDPAIISINSICTS